MGLENFEKSSFAAEYSGRRRSFDLYSLGDGAPVVLIQELPGIGPETISLAERLAAAGFAVTMPHLLGPLGKTNLVGNLFRVFCMRREFALFAKGRSSPIVSWLASLCQHVKAQSGAAGVGVIGMCLTGNFAITLMADDAVLASVAAQPAMPFAGRAALHMSQAEIEAARDGIDAAGPMLAYRFENDKICKAVKFDAINSAFNQDKGRVSLRTLPGDGHSVFTMDFVDEDGHPTKQALEEVTAYLSERLN